MTGGQCDVARDRICRRRRPARRCHGCSLRHAHTRHGALGEGEEMTDTSYAVRGIELKYLRKVLGLSLVALGEQ